ncbi:hypothetical protein DFQ28_005521 [Apophysomyces sp. BC1034]|nr:hypothetical protein DFQ30_006949 [Apophysomyces sp. BC1015]KAG0177680.1 hypothetical protein DFQ29_004535 [Apophysomyces sp. BC1021]KAG0187987.1 hypothetical protein DFQ28_005521 [Apophysomyces sp. BC1034]
MAARFTLASGITESVSTFSAYLATFSKRSLSLLLLLTVGLSVCFIYSSHSPNFLSTTPDAFLFARNASHLLSPGEYDCKKCVKPDVGKLDPRQIWEACLDPGVLPEYYLTVIMVTRNDDYAGNQYHRLQNAIDSTYLLAEKTQTLMELLIIEWNPPVGRRGVRGVYRYRRSKFLTYRIISVPSQIHRPMHENTQISLYEYEGKNLGLRYARGEFVVCTNQDDIWSANMQNAIVSRAWRKKMFYTQFQHSHVSHENLPSTIVKLDPFATDKDIESACAHDNYKLGSFEMPDPEQLDKNNFLRITHEASDFTLAHRDTWKKVGGYREAGASTWMDMELLLTAAWTLDIPVTYSKATFSCHQQHPTVVHPGSEKANQNINIDKMKAKEETHLNDQAHWGLQDVNLWNQDLKCEVFRGGLGM